MQYTVPVSGSWSISCKKTGAIIMSKNIKKSMKKTVMVILLICAVFTVISLLTNEKPQQQKQISHPLISEEVWDLQPLVERYAEEYHVSDHVDVLLAMMMQESGGRGDDPMQSSESYCGEIGCIDNPELSIKQGVYYFSQTLEAADGDIELAVQSYNFGKGFIDYVEKNAGKYSQEIAIDFSQKMYDEDRETYTCYRDEAKQYDACYGDIYYVRDVMAYKDALANG